MKISPIAKYLRENNAVSKKVGKNTVHFYTPKDEYLGTLTKGSSKGVKFVAVTIFNKKIKPIYSKLTKTLKKTVYVAGKTPEEDKLVIKSFTRIIEEKDFATRKKTQTIKENKLKSQLTPLKEYLPINIYSLKGDIKYSKTEILSKSETKF